jgi:TonB family protein
MLLIMALQAAVAFAQPPRRLSDSGRITYEDYPKEALERGQSGIVSAWLHVTPAGQVDRCAVTESSGFPTLDKATCRLAQTRSRFEPGRDGEGRATEGEFRLAMTWTTEQGQPRARIYAKLGIPAIPAGYVQPVSTMVVFGADGRVASCEVLASSGNGAADSAVCGSITQSMTIPRPKSSSPELAAAVRYYVASLVVEGSRGTDEAAEH